MKADLLPPEPPWISHCAAWLCTRCDWRAFLYLIFCTACVMLSWAICECLVSHSASWWSGKLCCGTPAFCLQVQPSGHHSSWWCGHHSSSYLLVLGLVGDKNKLSVAAHSSTRLNVTLHWISGLVPGFEAWWMDFMQLLLNNTHCTGFYSPERLNLMH